MVDPALFSVNIGPNRLEIGVSLCRLNNIGRVYFDGQDYRNAKLFYREALEIRRKVLGSHHLDVSATAFNAGQACHMTGELDEALSLYQEYMDITTRTIGTHHQGAITALKHMGQLFHEKNRAKEARAHYQQALGACRQVFGPVSREAASICNLLGNLSYENEDFDEAVEVYGEGLAMERTVMPDNCENILVTLSNIAQALSQKGDYQSALVKYNEVYLLQCLRPGGDTSKIIETLSIIGQISTLLGKYVEAEEAFMKVIAMSSEGQDNATALNYLGLLYFKQGLLDAAMKKFQESLSIRSCAPRAGSDVAVLFYNIASIYLHKGDNEGALRHYRHALDVERQNLGPVHPDVAITLKLIGKVHDRCGQYEEAIEHYSQAFEIYLRCHELDAPLSTVPSSGGKFRDAREHKRNAAKVLALVASVRLRQGLAGEMTEALSRAHRLFREMGLPIEELEMDKGFELYELSLLHPPAAAAA